jgi:leucyl aminopeptidase
MTTPATLAFAEADLDRLGETEGRIAVIVPPTGKLDQAGRRLNRLMRGALERFVDGEDFARMKEGEARDLSYPSGMLAEAVQVVKLDRKADAATARKAGAAIGKAAGGKAVAVLPGMARGVADIALGAMLRAYAFTDHKTADDEQPKGRTRLTFIVTDVAAAEAEAAGVAALAEGVFFTRDLTNEPANVLTTTEFAARLEAPAGTRAQGRGDGGGRARPARDAGAPRRGAGVGEPVEGRGDGMDGRGRGRKTARAHRQGRGLRHGRHQHQARRRHGGHDGRHGRRGRRRGRDEDAGAPEGEGQRRGLVGLVENMPDGRAQRPGDVVRTMKGDTVEVINTDAEGRLVLCDVMWYAQETWHPTAMIDLATLTGAIIIGLGHENAGVFSNDDPLCDAFLAAAKAEGEGAWRMPLGPAYDRMLKSRVADMKNVGGRPAGSITAAQFLQRFVKADMPWIHLDIAGVSSRPDDTTLAPKGARAGASSRSTGAGPLG